MRILRGCGVCVYVEFDKVTIPWSIGISGWLIRSDEDIRCCNLGWTLGNTEDSLWKFSVPTLTFCDMLWHSQDQDALFCDVCKLVSGYFRILFLAFGIFGCVCDMVWRLPRRALRKRLLEQQQAAKVHPAEPAQHCCSLTQFTSLRNLSWKSACLSMFFGCDILFNLFDATCNRYIHVHSS